MSVIATASVVSAGVSYAVGANDVSNAMGTSVGSGALSRRAALVLAGVMEAFGVLLIGRLVSDTIRFGIVQPAPAPQAAFLFVLGMLATLIASFVWLLVATLLSWPVSTTHTIVSDWGAVGVASSLTAAASGGGHCGIWAAGERHGGRQQDHNVQHSGALSPNWAPRDSRGLHRRRQISWIVSPVLGVVCGFAYVYRRARARLCVFVCALLTPQQRVLVHSHFSVGIAARPREQRVGVPAHGGADGGHRCGVCACRRVQDCLWLCVTHLLAL